MNPITFEPQGRVVKSIEPFEVIRKPEFTLYMLGQVPAYDASISLRAIAEVSWCKSQAMLLIQTTIAERGPTYGEWCDLDRATHRIVTRVGSLDALVDAMNGLRFDLAAELAVLQDELAAPHCKHCGERVMPTPETDTGDIVDLGWVHTGTGASGRVYCTFGNSEKAEPLTVPELAAVDNEWSS